MRLLIRPAAEIGFGRLAGARAVGRRLEDGRVLVVRLTARAAPAQRESEPTPLTFCCFDRQGQDDQNVGGEHRLLCSDV